MKRIVLITCLFHLLAHCPAIGQVSPEILPDGRVTFRIVALEAQEVSVRGQWSGKPLMLHRGNKGLWEGTTPEPVQPGVHEYSFRIDDYETIDSRNRVIKPQRWPKTSILHIPANPPAHWDLQDIPHGTVHFHDYYSKTLDTWRKLVVYTPPGADRSKERLPVLYLAHGYSDNETTWTVTGRANHIADSLIHQKLAKPMIIVMPDAHPLDPEYKRIDNYLEGNQQAFVKEMVEDIVPFIEQHYKVDKRASQRAFAGLSMGGGHAFAMALQHHDRFSWIGAFSPLPPKPELLKKWAQVGAMNKDLNLFWIACGNKDFLFDQNQTAHAAMTEMGIEHEYVITEGDYHSWPVWRGYLVTLLPKLFKDSR